MERFQGQVEPCSLDRKTDMISLEVQAFTEAQSFIFEEEEDLSLKDTIPFLQMLQNGDPSPFITLLSLQSLNNPYELESYKVEDLHSLIQSETNHFNQRPISMEGVDQANIDPSSSYSQHTANSKRKRKTSQEMSQEKRKRKRSKPLKNMEDMENQRIIHIAVERNRRRLMNDHINSLRSLLPPSYIQRGDQASIVGGAINYVKVLEQLIQSLESQRRMRNGNENAENEHDTNLLSGISSNNLRVIPKIEATVIQNHVNLKVQCQRKQGELLKGIISLEELRLTVLHLNITSSPHESISYSFNLKMEDDCDLGSADEITAAAYKIFDIQRIDSTNEPK